MNHNEVKCILLLVISHFLFFSPIFVFLKLVLCVCGETEKKNFNLVVLQELKKTLRSDQQR